jgi:mRNA deadenylase 3'-5' endonuclease subunit Ccr4
MSFLAATYNVLCSAYVRPEWYPGVCPGLLDPAVRLPALVRHVEGLNADLLCLQEVEQRAFAALGQRLGPLGYEGYYEKKGGSKRDGCATLFRKSLFTQRSRRRLDYHDRRPGQPADSGHVALLLCLEHEGRLLGVANTHIRWDEPATPREEQVGYRQIVEALQACQEFSPRCDGWLVCGDFNRTPDEEGVQAMRQAGFAFSHDSSVTARSCVANGRARLIDYIFHSQNLQSRPVEPPLLKDDTRLPSPEQPSDHLALLAEVGWVGVNERATAPVQP